MDDAAAPTPPPLTQPIRVVVTDTEQPPTAADWAAGEVVADVAAGVARARVLADGFVTADAYRWVWVGCSGPLVGWPTVPGVWRAFLKIGPPGWPDEEAERRDRETKAWFAHKAAQAEAAEIARKAASDARRLAREADRAANRTRDESFDAIR